MRRRSAQKRNTGDTDMKTYVTLGDSITAGVGADMRYESYPVVLQSLLKSNFEDVEVHNEGIPGARAIDIIKALPGIIKKYPVGATYIITIGTNDIHGHWIPGLWMYPGDTGYRHSFKRRVQMIIDTIISSGSSIYLGRLLPTFYQGRNSYREDRIHINDLVIRQLEQENALPGSPDFKPVFRRKKNLMSDCVHPNNYGYKLMAQSWLNCLLHTH